jgi:hypothetical protein
MTLKTEQKLIGSQFTEFEPTVYTTGAHLIPLKIIVNGIEKYIWVVNEFNNDIYCDGENCSANVIADNVEELIFQD